MCAVKLYCRALWWAGRADRPSRPVTEPHRAAFVLRLMMLRVRTHLQHLLSQSIHDMLATAPEILHRKCIIIRNIKYYTA